MTTLAFINVIAWPALFGTIGLVRLRCALRSNELLARLVERSAP